MGQFGSGNLQIKWSKILSCLASWRRVLDFIYRVPPKTIRLLFTKIKAKFWGVEYIGKKYLRLIMSGDEMAFLEEKFYDRNANKFRNSAYIDINDGKGVGLLNRFVIYRSANVSYWNSFPYNLQPWAKKYLNDNLKKGNITIYGNTVYYRL